MQFLPLFAVLLLSPLSLAKDSSARRAAIPPPVTDPKSIADQEIKTLATQVGTQLQKNCKQLHGAEVEVTFSNKTEESLDPDLVKSTLAGLLSKGKAKKVTVQSDMTSSKEEKDGHYKGTYTLTARVLEGGKPACSEEKTLTKETQRAH